MRAGQWPIIEKIESKRKRNKEIGAHVKGYEAWKALDYIPTRYADLT